MLRVSDVGCIQTVSMTALLILKGLCCGLLLDTNDQVRWKLRRVIPD